MKVIEINTCYRCPNHDDTDGECSQLQRIVSCDEANIIPFDCPLPSKDEYTESNFNIDGQLNPASTKYFYTEFISKFINHMVKVNPKEDLQTRWYRLFETEKERVQQFLDRGYTVATIYMGNDPGDEEVVSYPEFEQSREHPFVQGYFIIEKGYGI